MSAVNHFLGFTLGWLMVFCYHIVKNYGMAIILFTLLTKVILFPVSIWVQKNSVKIIKLQPEINHIKAEYFGDKETIADKQAELYKREKYNPFASILPTVLQLIVLSGLVGVIRNPMSAIPENEMTLCGLDVALVPAKAGGITLLMPVMAATAAWLLCFAQNKNNPLQAEQGKWNQNGMTLLSVSISLFLGAYVPLGVGFYWIWSNFFGILNQLILNRIIKPEDYIDYNQLEKSKAELAELESIGKQKRLFGKDPYRKKERADYKRFFSVANKHLVFYSEGSGFFKYFADFIEYLLEHSNIVIHYITSDPEDAIFENKNPRIKAYYIGEKKLITLMMKMDADIVVMTMPDLENFHIKRSYVRNDIEYIYTGHGVGSNNLLIREKGLAHFDTLFCVGPHQVEEYRKEEEIFGIKRRNLVEVGYCLMDNMRRHYQNTSRTVNEKKTILIGPSWQKDNILDSCIDILLEQIVGKGYRIIVRPHPQYVRLYAGRIDAFIARWNDKLSDDFIIETDFSSNVTVYTADLVVTDWSNIGYEFSFSTNKPTLYINTPVKIMNPNYNKLGIVPFDIRIRQEIGAAIELDGLDAFGEKVEELIRRTPEYYDVIEKIRTDSFYNSGRAREVGGQYILERLMEKQENRKHIGTP